MSPVEPYASLRWPTDIVDRNAKVALATSAARRVVEALGTGPGRRVGLGSGTTSFLTLLALAAVRDALPEGTVLVATSYEMEWYASAAGFEVDELGAGPVVVAVDGADQVDPAGALVKGRGGAMHRERAVLAAAATELIVADPSKSVARLGGCPLPLVLAPDGIVACVAGVESLGAGPVALRPGTGKDGPVLTESGGVLADLLVPAAVEITTGLDAALRAVPGVMETGYFPPSPVREVLDR